MVMNSKNFIGLNLIGVFALLIMAANMSACKKDEGPAVGEILVVDSLGKAVPNANIVLSCTSSLKPAKPCNVKEEGKADAAGKYRTEYSLPKVLKITASSVVRDTTITGVLPKLDTVIKVDSVCGEAFISLKKDETNSKTVVLHVCN